MLHFVLVKIDGRHVLIEIYDDAFGAGPKSADFVCSLPRPFVSFRRPRPFVNFRGPVPFLNFVHHRPFVNCRGPRPFVNFHAPHPLFIFVAPSTLNQPANATSTIIC